jgi:hypothetical protein
LRGGKIAADYVLVYVSPNATQEPASVPARCDLFIQVLEVVVLAQFESDRVGHDLAPVNLGRLAPVDRCAPTCLRIVMNGYLEIASADPLLHDLFQFSCRLLLLIHVSFLTLKIYRCTFELKNSNPPASSRRAYPQ